MKKRILCHRDHQSENASTSDFPDESTLSIKVDFDTTVFPTASDAEARIDDALWALEEIRGVTVTVECDTEVPLTPTAPSTVQLEIDQLAYVAVSNMGDIFYDEPSFGVTEGGGPEDIATQQVTAAIKAFALKHGIAV